jgi:hypothetical protein
VRNWVFLILSTIFTLYILIDTGKLNDLLANWSDEPLPTKDDLALYFSQGFYYVTMLVGVVYVVRKFKAKHNSKSE